MLLATAGMDEIPFPGAQSHIFMQSAGGKLVDETVDRIRIVDAVTGCASTADIDGDGDIDVYMGNVPFGHPGGSQALP
jgi:hypothetical protein